MMMCVTRVRDGVQEREREGDDRANVALGPLCDAMRRRLCVDERVLWMS